MLSLLVATSHCRILARGPQKHSQKRHCYLTCWHAPHCRAKAYGAVRRHLPSKDLLSVGLFVLLESCDHLLTAWSRLICWLCRRSTGFYYAGHTSCLPTVTKWAEGRGAAHAPQIQPLKGMAAVLGASHFPPAVNLRGWVDRAHFPAVCLAPPSQLCSNECWCPQ